MNNNNENEEDGEKCVKSQKITFSYEIKEGEGSDQERNHKSKCLRSISSKDSSRHCFVLIWMMYEAREKKNTKGR